MSNEDYSMEFAKLVTKLSAIVLDELEGKDNEYKIKVGASALSALIANFCHALVKKEYKDKSINLLDEMYLHSKVLLLSLYNDISEKTIN